MINEEKINKILKLREEFLKIKDKILAIEKNNPQVFKKVKWGFKQGFAMVKRGKIFYRSDWKESEGI